MSSKLSARATSRLAPPLAGQRGVVLFIALIVMVAMSLAAIALVRSVDTANLVAGNQAFKQGALNATDLGVATAMDRFSTAVVNSALSSDAPTHSDLASSCYRASTFLPGELDGRGIPRLLLDPTTAQAPFSEAFDATYTAANNCSFTNTNGETVRYIIDRQCDASGAPTIPNCNLVSTSTSGRTDSDLHTGSESVAIYRVTVRVDGPRHTTSFAQVIFRP